MVSKRPLRSLGRLLSEADVLLRGAPALAEPARGATGWSRTTRDLSRPKLAGDGQTAQYRRAEEIWGSFVRGMAERGAEIGEERGVLWIQEHGKVANTMSVKKVLLKAVFNLWKDLRAKLATF